MAQIDALRAIEPRKGTRKLHAALHAAGVPVGRDRLFATLRDAGQLVPRKRRAVAQTTYSQHRYAVAPNLLRDRPVTAPRQVVVSDITYLTLPRGTFAYLFLVTDRFARYIVGWHLSRDLSHHAALLALHHAQHTLGDTRGIVHHSDRGTQYCCHAYRQQLHAAHMLPSMTDGAHCYQNAVAERVNGILKDEFDLDAVFPSFAAAHDAVAWAIHRYNHIRTHGNLALQTPHAVFTRAEQSGT
jgi:transposase InsO family protein